MWLTWLFLYLSAPKRNTAAFNSKSSAAKQSSPVSISKRQARNYKTSPSLCKKKRKETRSVISDQGLWWSVSQRVRARSWLATLGDRVRIRCCMTRRGSSSCSMTSKASAKCSMMRESTCTWTRTPMSSFKKHPTRRQSIRKSSISTRQERSMFSVLKMRKNKKLRGSKVSLTISRGW